MKIISHKHNWLELPVARTDLNPDTGDVRLVYTRHISDYRYCDRCDCLERRYIRLGLEGIKSNYLPLSEKDPEYRKVLRFMEDLE